MHYARYLLSKHDKHMAKLIIYKYNKSNELND